MVDKVYTLRTSPGIKRDGTQFESTNFVDGEWCRFQRGKPKKVGGARLITAEPNDITRGLLTHSINGSTYTWSGSKTGINGFVANTEVGLAAGPFPVTFNNFLRSLPVASITSNNNIELPGNQTNSGSRYLANGDTISIFDPSDSTDHDYEAASVTYVADRDRTLIALSPEAGSPTVVPGEPSDGEVNPSIINVDTGNPINVDNDNDRYSWTFNVVYDPAGYAFRTVSHFSEALATVDTTVKYPVYTGRMIPQIDSTTDNQYKWEVDVLRDIDGQNPTGAVIEADGGVAAIYPFLFVYGSNGFIANNHVTTFDEESKGEYGTVSLQDWNGPTANSVNVAAGKILHAEAIRGGTTSPSALFWATDALIRVSFTGTAPLYWRYDLVSTDCSTMNKDCVIQQDGIYYWVGTDRFYQYNGTVQPLPNDTNLNYFFDNLNNNERGKVFGVTVKRFNEIWWFYPHGDATECNNAIVYNTKEKIWYDMGFSPLCKRSAGVPAGLFPYPVFASNDFEFDYGTGFEILESTENTVTIAGNQSNNLPGTYVTLELSDPLGEVRKVLSAVHDLAEDTTLVTVDPAWDEAPRVGSYIRQYQGGYGLYQHEFGKNKVFYSRVTAIESSFTTDDISFLGGNPAQQSPIGDNRQLKLFRLEPDFIQTGMMSVQYLGRSYSRGDETFTEEFEFGPDTGKIDSRIQYRQIKLKFTSNDIDGHYEMGDNLILAVPGDERA